eukprot:m.192451 g.192451  ORF g.192451 m.192451 type:complete len:255 (+) comp10597_c2_seq4:3335-4099(+)
MATTPSRAAAAAAAASGQEDDIASDVTPSTACAAPPESPAAALAEDAQAMHIDDSSSVMDDADADADMDMAQHVPAPLLAVPFPTVQPVFGMGAMHPMGPLPLAPPPFQQSPVVLSALMHSGLRAAEAAVAAAVPPRSAPLSPPLAQTAAASQAKPKRRRRAPRKRVKDMTDDELRRIRELNNASARKHRANQRQKSLSARHNFEQILERNAALRQTRELLLAQRNQLMLLVAHQYAQQQVAAAAAVAAVSLHA